MDTGHADTVASAGRVRTDDDVSLVGHDIDGRYRVISHLGRGGMGAVYLARQSMVDRNVALKVIREQHLADPRAVRRFMDEARASCAVHHPNVVTVHDFGRTRDGLLYLAMEHIEGETLRDIVRRGPMELERACRIGGQICAGLSEAHRRGIIHRDLKPENIMVSSATAVGEIAKLLDFGIAKSIQPREAQMTNTGALMGTPLYMSPEQCRGEAVDARSDIYALGVILFEMLSGVPPFTAENTVALLLQHNTKKPPRLEDVAPKTPPPPGGLLF